MVDREWLAWLRSERGLPTAASALLALAGTVLWLLPAPLWWLGGGLLAAALTVGLQVWGSRARQGWESFDRPRELGRLRLRPASLMVETLCIGLVVYVATQMLGDAVHGDRPVSGDHPVHYFKAWYLRERLLPQGQLMGWSHRWFAGYPANYLYPIGADLWIAATHLLGMGHWTFSEAYGIGYWLFWVFSGYAIYRYGQRLGGPWVGLLAAVLFLTDTSVFRQGGWTYNTTYGVWPQSLSMAFGILAAAHLQEIVAGTRWRAVALFALLTGLGLVAHPMLLILLPIMLVVATVAAVLDPEVKAAAGLLRLGLGMALSGVVAAVWLLPFLSSKSEVSPMGLWWKTAYQMGAGLLDLDVLDGTLALALALGLIGLVLALRSRSFFPFFTGLLALFIPAVSNSTFIDELHLPAFSEAFTKVQFIRMSTMVKPFWFVLAAHAAMILARGAHRFSARRRAALPQSYLHAGVLAFGVAFLAVPMLVPFAEAFWTRQVHREVDNHSEREWLEHRRALVRWARKGFPDDHFYRIAIYGLHQHDHRLLDLGTEIDKPFYKVGFTPCSNFRYKVESGDHTLIDAVDVRYAISERRLHSDDYELLERFGPLRVYEYEPWTPEPFQILEGEGEVSVKRWDDETLVLRAAEGAHGKLQLPVSYFSRWKAYRDGQRIPIRTLGYQADPDNTGFMVVDLKPGTYRFEFRPLWIDRAALPLSIVALLLCAWLVLADFRVPGTRRVAGWLESARERAGRLSEPRWRKVRLAALTTAALGVLGGTTVLALWRPPVEPEEDELRVSISRVRYDFLESLPDAEVEVVYPRATYPCVRQKDRFVCPNEDGDLQNDEYIASHPGEMDKYEMFRCVRARPIDDGTLRIRYDDVPLGDAVVGYYGLTKGDNPRLRPPVDFRLHVDGRRIHQGSTMRGTESHWFLAHLPPSQAGRRATVTFTVDAKRTKKRPFCFNAQAVDLH